jgi:hypothetical protein
LRLRVKGVARHSEKSVLNRYSAILPHQTDKLVFRIRLAKVMIHAKFTGVIAVFLGNARGDHDDGQIAQMLVSPDIARQIKAIHAWHFDV